MNADARHVLDDARAVGVAGGEAKCAYVRNHSTRLSTIARPDFRAHWRIALGHVAWAHAGNVEQGARRQPPPVLRDADEHDRYAATACCKAVTAGVATPTMTSGSSASNSRAYARKLSGRPAAH